MNKRSPFWLVFALAGCSGAGNDSISALTDDGQLPVAGVAVVAAEHPAWALISTLPPTVKCVQVVAAAGTQSAARSFDVDDGGQTALLNLHDLLANTDTLSALGFERSCDQLDTSSAADFVSDDEDATAGANGTPVPITLHANNSVQQNCRGNGPPNDKISIDQIVYSGDGCPAGSVVASLASDKLAATLLFSAFSASVGPGIPAGEAKQQCAIDFKLHVPSGLTFALSTIDYRGFYHLDNQVTGRLDSTVSAPGSSNSAQLSHTFTGPSENDYLVTDKTPLKSLAWAECGQSRHLHINAGVQVDAHGNATRQGLLTVDTADESLTQIFHLQWKKCR